MKGEVAVTSIALSVPVAMKNQRTLSSRNSDVLTSNRHSSLSWLES